MSEPSPLSDPERLLMLAYVPADRRAALATLWELDMRLGQVVATTTEPAIGAIRLAWWRDALLRLDQAPAPAEPLLQQVAETLLPFVSGAMLAPLAESWDALLDDALPDEGLDAYGEARGAALFGVAAFLLGGEAGDVRPFAGGWVLADVAHGSSDMGLRRAALAAAGRALDGWDGRVARQLRPLGMLGMLARQDVAAGPDQPRRQGSPARMLAMLRYRLTGR
jgi:phytoene synthase